MAVPGKKQEALVADPSRATVQLLRSLLLSRRIFTLGAHESPTLWRLLDACPPDLIVLSHCPPALDAAALTSELRRSDLAARKTPVVMLADDPTPTQVRAARDAGVHEVLRRPFSLANLLLRIDAVLDKPRPWVEGVSYVGPDRRRFNSALPSPRRRLIDKQLISPQSARAGQALEIMKLAIEAIDCDPRQALRALLAQAAELQQVAIEMTDYDLAGAAKGLTDCLKAAVKSGRFSSSQTRSNLRGLFPSVSSTAGESQRLWWVS